MKIVQIHVERTYNLGDFNSFKCGVTQELEDGDDPAVVFTESIKLIYAKWKEERKRYEEIYLKGVTKPCDPDRIPKQLGGNNAK